MKKYVAKGRKRQIQLQVRLNEIEYDKLKTDVEQGKMTISEYIRSLILGAELKERPGYEFYEVMKQMTRIGVNLNQIAKKANMLNVIDKEEYKAQAENWNKFTKEVKRKYL